MIYLTFILCFCEHYLKLETLLTTCVSVLLRFKVSVNTEAETSVMFYLVYEELLARHSGIYQYTVTIISNVKP